MQNSVDFYQISRKEERFASVLSTSIVVFLFFIIIYFTLFLDLSWDLFFLLILSLALGTALTLALVLQRKTVFVYMKERSAKFFFENIGYENLVARYYILLRHRKDVLKIFIGFLIIFGFLIYNTFENEIIIEQNKEKAYKLFVGLILVFGIMAWGQTVVIRRFLAWDDFDFFHTRACFTILSKDSGLRENVKSRLIMAGLNSYSNYLRLEHKMHIAKPENFYLNIISDSRDSMEIIVTEIVGNLTEDDKLEFLRYLKKLHHKSESDFIVQDRTSKKVIELLGLVIIPITMVIIYVVSSLL